jgi:hypothetical protein
MAHFASHTLESARNFVLRELGMMEVEKTIISSNAALRKDGGFRAGKSNLDEPGVAVYFIYGDKTRVMACDAWLHVEDNLWAIGLALQANRKQAKWGVDSLERLFQVYVPTREEQTQPPPRRESAQQSPAGELAWWTVLGIDPITTKVVAQQAYWRLAKETHPDLGGSHEQFIRVQHAWEQACKACGW